ncbi:UPF0746 protein DDB_G0281095-like [Anastrepha ludens]|uniref:UPF0746 protein DDB_G0281095-like n=1 Tax=Anastrepha ludens TaxID=28586 RepID=UPI0023B0699D|nr:UPF0746 protein DDB_G0281095-like [Anastrepha ludens]
MSIDLNIQNLTQLFWTSIIILNLYVALLLFRMSKVYRSERKIKLLETANIKEHIEFMRSRPDKSVSQAFSSTGNFTTRSRFFEQFLESNPAQLRSFVQVRPNFRSNSSTTGADEESEERHTQLVKEQQIQQQIQQPYKQRSKQLQMDLQRKDNKAQNYEQQQQRQQQQQQPQQQIYNQAQHRYEGILNQQQQQPHQVRRPPMIEQTSSEETPKSDDEHTLYISDSFGRVVHEIPFRECDYMDALQVVLGDQRWKIKTAWNDRYKTNMKRVN